MVLAAGLPDHYGVLELARDADEGTIKRSYRRLVLLWHPDKHPADRVQAESKIRDINGAYEVLGNPQCRSHYDQQLVAVERHSQGIRLDTSAIQPRMSIPREFMLCPLGYPDKFIRTVGNSIFVHSREDVALSHAEFFKDAKFSLWWCAQRNNMCHIRAQSTAAQGKRGGLHFSFLLSSQSPEPTSETVLTPLEEPQTFYVALASPMYQGAFRFEAAFYPGHYLSFAPPTHWKLASTAEGNAVVDFMLVDYSTMFRYLTLEEALVPVVQRLGGEHAFVSLDAVRLDAATRRYFIETLKKPVWGKEDFETYFAAHYEQWHFDVAGSRVRIRSKLERLEVSLQAAASPGELAAAVACAGDDLSKLQLQDAERTIEILSQPLPEGSSVTDCVNYKAARQRMLVVIGPICRQASLLRLLSLHAKVEAMGREAPRELQAQRAEALTALGLAASQQLQGPAANITHMPMESFARLVCMSLDWTACGDRVLQLAVPLFAVRPLEDLLPVLRALAQPLAPVSTQPLRHAAAEAAERLLPSAPAEVAIEALGLLVEFGAVDTDTGSQALRQLLAKSTATPPAVVALAVLAEKGVEDGDLLEIAERVGKVRAAVEGLQSSDLLRLAVAATKSAAVAEHLLVPYVRVAASRLHSWSMDDLSKLLLAVTKSKGTTGGRDVEALFRGAGDVVRPQLPSLSATQLIKVSLAVGRAPACRDLLDATAEEAGRRLGDFPPAQLLLLTQGLLPLGAKHSAVLRVLDAWWELCREAEREDRRVLQADQLAKLVHLLAPVVPSHGIYEALARRVVAQAKELSEAGRSCVEATFPDIGSGPDFRGRRQMLQVARNPDASVKWSRSRSRSHGDGGERRRSPEPRREARRGGCSREREAPRRGSRERRSHDRRGRGRRRGSRSRDRDRERERGHDRSRERDRRRAAPRADTLHLS